MKKILLCFALLVGLNACNQTVSPPDITLGKNYYPLEVGRYVAYNVREIRYSVNQMPQILTYQLREEVAEVVRNPANQESYRIVRYTRPNGRQNWEAVKYFLARADQYGVVRTEDNLPLMVLVFPLREDAIWNGNVYNNLGRKTFIMQDIGKAHRLDNRLYDQTVTVIQSRDSNIVNKDFRTEIFADSIGLIYRRTEQVAYCQTPACLGKAQIESGNVIELTVIDFGRR